MSNELLTDEMPVAPAIEDDVPFGHEVSVDGSMSMDEVDLGVPMGEPVPNGWYTLRADKFTAQEKINLDGMGADPYYKVEFTVTEPLQYAGRKVFETFTVMRKYDRERLAAKDPAAQQIARNRLGKVKEFLKALNWTQKAFDFEKDVLLKKPEVKAKLGKKERKDKNSDTGKWDIPTGKFDNTINEYAPLQRR